MIRAARKLFKERGYDNVTIDDITAACGLTKGAFYYSFDAKSDLIYEIERLRFNVLAHKLQNSGKSGLDQLDMYITSWVGYLKKDDVNITRQWFAHNLNPETKKSTYGTTTKGAFDDDLNFITRFLNEAVEKNEVAADAPIDTIAQYICLQLYGYAAYCCMYEIKGKEMMAWGEQFVQNIHEHFLQPVTLTKK